MNRSYEMQPVQTVEVLPKNQWEEETLAVKDNAYALAATDAFCDMLRAGLTKQAMDNTAVLAKFEEHYNSIAPTGSAEYRLIVQTYARMAMESIARRSFR